MYSTIETIGSIWAFRGRIASLTAVKIAEMMGRGEPATMGMGMQTIDSPMLGALLTIPDRHGRVSRTSPTIKDQSTIGNTFQRLWLYGPKRFTCPVMGACPEATRKVLL